MPTAAVVSFRLGGTDGVSVEAAKWIAEFRGLAFDVRTVAGCPPADVVVPGMAWGARDSVTPEEVRAAIDGADVVIVENLLSLPLNPAASAAVASALVSRPAILRHHDLPWQRDGAYDANAAPPNDPAWAHVVINERSRLELATRGIDSICLYNRFPLHGWDGDRAGTRSALGLAGPVVLHPVRAIARKNIPAALRLAEALGATYWLTGDAEEGYGDELSRVFAQAACPVVHRRVGSIGDAYAAADAVALPSTREGFGNPAIESALARRPLAIGTYAVSDELAGFGFRWFPADDPGPLRAFLDDPDDALIQHNRLVAEEHFGIDGLAPELSALLDRVLG